MSNRPGRPCKICGADSIPNRLLCREHFRADVRARYRKPSYLAKRLERLHTPEARRRSCERQKQPKALARKRFYATGWTAETFETAWKKQQELCAICHVKMVKRWNATNGVCADHDHSTKRTRELLCNKCNRALGLFYESADLLERATAYLRRHGSGSEAFSRGEVIVNDPVAVDLATGTVV